MDQSAVNDSTPAPPSTGDAIRGSTRGRGRGGPRGERGRGGNNRGRGGQSRGGRGGPSSNQSRMQGAPMSMQELAQAYSTTRPPQATNGAGETDQPQKPAATTDIEEDDGMEICFICAGPVVHNSVSPCNHRTCHICALRMRALYKNRACLHCRTNAETVIFTDDPEKRFEDFAGTDFARADDNLGIKFENLEIFEDTVLLLRYNCPDSSCDVACYGWPDLHRHVRNVHHKIMCDLCTRNKKVFTHEHTLFTRSELSQHERNGDDHPGAENQSGFKGHPECGFCKERFYGDDELYTHCRDKHERCHICDRRNGGRQQQYFLDYNGLEVHFRKDHFLCPDAECMEKKFVVFESEIDLKAHQLEAHPNGLTKDARRDARRVDMSSFDYRQQYQEPQRGGRREGRGRGRGRDPNVDAPLPVSSAQPLRRDELAYQRQMAIHSAQSISNRTFGGQLTSGDAFAARAPTAAAPQTITAPRNAPSESIPVMDGLSLGPAGPVTAQLQPQTPQDQARALRHAAVSERAANLLGNDASKLSTFRNTVSSFRNNAISATNLIDSFFALFDTSSGELGTLVKELAEIFEVTGKRDDLLKAWHDWRAINEDYPSLPGPNGAPASNTAGVGKRILKLKTSTAQSSRSAVNQRAGWGSLGAGMPSSKPVARSASHFPNLPANPNRAGPGKVTTTPWVTPSASSSRPASTASTPRPRANVAAPPPHAVGAFPALPMAQKPGMNVSRPGYFGNPVLKSRSGSSTPVGSAWGSGGVSGITSPSEVVDDAEEEGLGGKRKGKKKQTLIHWG